MSWAILGIMACGEPIAEDPVTLPPELPTLPEIDVGESSEQPGGWRIDVEPPQSLGPGYLNLSAPIAEDGHMVVSAGDVSSATYPDRTTAHFGDVDSDGNTEVIVANLNWHPTETPVLVYRFVGNNLVYAPELTDSIHKATGMVSAVMDLDGDGISDVVGMTNPDAIAYGTGDGKFGETLDFPTPPTYPTDFRAQGAMHLADMDQDGWLDILLGDGLCSEGAKTLNILMRNGLRSYRSRMDLVLPQEPAGSAYAVYAGPIGTNGMALYSGGGACSNADPNEPVFLRSSETNDGFPIFAAKEITPFESAYKESTAVSYGPLTLGRPMSLVSSDLNGDGVLDFFTTLSEYYAIFEGGDSIPFTDHTQNTGIKPPPSSTGRAMIPWGMGLVDLDRDGRQDIVVTHGSGEDISFLEGPLAIGPQHTTAYWNAGDFHFVDITFLTGLKVPGNWRSLVTGDLNRDGAPDLAVGGLGQHPTVFLNQIETEGVPIGFQFKGTTSNHLGFGTRVRHIQEDGLLGPVQIVGGAASPLATSEPYLFSAIPTGETGAFEITWPTGQVQRIENATGNTLNIIEEPPLVTLSTKSRHLPADGNSELRVDVFPRDISGNLRNTEEVEVAIAYGEATWKTPMISDETGSWYGVLQAPMDEGTTLLEITIDGKRVEIRPRVWWDKVAP